MTGKRRDLSSEEQRLWRRVASTVKQRRAAKAEPAPADERVPAIPRAKPPTPAQPKPTPTKRASPVADRGGEKKIRRGKVELEATLDLHGYGQDAARAALHGFLRQARGRGARTVLVITGAGRGGEGVLKRRLPDWLEQSDLRPLIAGVAPAHRSHGGGGAFYVFLKRK